MESKQYEITLNNIQVPITRVEEIMNSCYRREGRYLTSRIDNKNIIDLHINSSFSYKKKYYYDLFNSNGLKIKEDFHVEYENKKESYFIDELSDFLHIYKAVIYINGDFRIVFLDANGGYSTISDISELKSRLSTYTKIPSLSYTHEGLIPVYTAYHGHSQKVEMLLNRLDLCQTYDDLILKKEQAIKNCKDYSCSSFNREEWDLENIELSFRWVVEGICNYLFITENQFKSGRFNLIDKLNKRLNYNINNKNK